MPNNGRITLCPYYKDEKNLSISCEDTFRRFRYKSQKKRWMDDYCDDRWQECPYAESMETMYERMCGMQEHEQEILRLTETNKALKSELKKTAMLLGKAEKRLKSKDESLERQRKMHRATEKLYLRYRDMALELKAGQKQLAEDMQGLANMYEAMFAYLISEYGGGYFDYNRFKDWHSGKQFRIIPEMDGDKVIGYRVEVIDENRGTTRENAKASESEAEEK